MKIEDRFSVGSGGTRISAILPPKVASAERLGEPNEELFACEEDIVRNAVVKRRMEFAAGRACAHEAVGLLGFGFEPILTGFGREPLWPSGVIGSITHCEGYCAAAATITDGIISLGIDAEPNEALPSEVLSEIASREEIEALSRIRDSKTIAGRGVSWDRLIFSAKESMYKAWYPLTRSWLGFRDVSVTIYPVDRCFCFQFLGHPPALLHSVEVMGRYTTIEKLILTSVVMTRSLTEQQSEIHTAFMRL